MSRTAMLADLKRSGLTTDDAKKLGYKVLTGKQTKERTDFDAASYLIPYYDITGKLTDFWRVRYLEEVRGPFGAIKKKPPRYSQSRGTLPRFYFPKNVPTTWRAIAKNPKVGLIITEGEKKAAAACKNELPTISVGGVWAWRSKKHGLPTIPDFKLIQWEDRDVRLCFDNDLMTNPLVIGALNALAHELTSRGAKVYITYLPKGPGKIGLDDYLLKRSPEGFAKLKNDAYAESAELWSFNTDVCYVRKLKAFYCFSLRVFFKTKTELLTAYERLSYQVPKANGEGFKTMYTAAEWCKWAQRQEYEDIVFIPGEEIIVNDKINTWEGWPIEPKEGNVKPFYDLLTFVFASEPTLMTWFLQWAAYPLQHPGAKVLNAILIHSRTTGMGKSFIGLILRDIYGPANSITIEQDQLHSDNNYWAASKQFILGEEITGTDSRKDADRIKNMITRETVNINIKYQPQYVLNDCANYFLTSNHVDALFLDEHDRRVVVHEIPALPREQKFYERIDKWRKHEGPAYLFYHLLNDIDTSGFNPRSPAPVTQAKRDMVDLSKSDLDLAVDELRSNPEHVLRFQKIAIPQDLLTTTQLVAFLFPTGDRVITAIATSKALRRAGFRQRVIKTKQGTKKLWAARNTNKWTRATSAEWCEHFNENVRDIKFK